MRTAELPSTRFVVISAARSGSNMLCGMLNSHPQVLCHHEMFHPINVWYAFGYRDGEIDLGTTQERDRSPGDFIEAIWRNHLGHHAVGFKLLRSQSWKAHKYVLYGQTVKKILLVRKGRLAVYVSHQVARQTGRYSTAQRTPAREDGASVRVNLRSFKRYSARNNRYFGKVRKVLHATRQDYLELYYEDLLSEDVKTRLLEYLQVDPDPGLINPVNKKQATTPLRHRIVNANDLADQLRGTEHEWELAG